MLTGDDNDGHHGTRCSYFALRGGAATLAASSSRPQSNLGSSRRVIMYLESDLAVALESDGGCPVTGAKSRRLFDCLQTRVRQRLTRRLLSRLESSQRQLGETTVCQCEYNLPGRRGPCRVVGVHLDNGDLPRTPEGPVAVQGLVFLLHENGHSPGPSK
mmetsp:Transcript_1950/g.5902  ORF Transcript_1950/g.5902 Transcript_1950/m.5902 type:complete len:159 (-) Transcript_1950:409-885(-)